MYMRGDTPHRVFISPAPPGKIVLTQTFSDPHIAPMEKTIQVLNRMVTDKIIESYAVGGGIAALFYIEPVTTFDLDVFVFLPAQPTPLVSLTPLYAWLTEHGYRPEKEQVVVEGVPVQFIPVYNDLVTEATRQAVTNKYGTTPVRVVTAEYLMAIMVQTYRPKDRERLVRFLEEATIDHNLLRNILERHHLLAVYEGFRKDQHG
jgi:hypothetical protein